MLHSQCPLKLGGGGVAFKGTLCDGWGWTIQNLSRAPCLSPQPLAQMEKGLCLESSFPSAILSAGLQPNNLQGQEMLFPPFKCKFTTCSTSLIRKYYLKVRKDSYQGSRQQQNFLTFKPSFQPQEIS